MITHKLPHDYSVVLPFGRITLRSISRVCKGQNRQLLEAGNGIILFPDGRLSVKQGFVFKLPKFFLVPDRKVYVPSMVYDALDEFGSLMPYRDFIWNHVRKKVFITMMKTRRVNFLTIQYVRWKL